MRTCITVASLERGQNGQKIKLVPAENLIALKLPWAEAISWREFIATLWTPLLEQLVAGGPPDTVVDVLETFQIQ